jgi:hypothetical protein
MRPTLHSVAAEDGPVEGIADTDTDDVDIVIARAEAGAIVVVAADSLVRCVRRVCVLNGRIDVFHCPSTAVRHNGHWHRECDADRECGKRAPHCGNMLTVLTGMAGIVVTPPSTRKNSPLSVDSVL